MDEQLQNALKPLRLQIDEIDHTIQAALAQRALIAQQIGETKQTHHATGVYDEARERAMLDVIEQRDASLLPPTAVRAVFQSIITACRQLQEKPLSE